MVFIWRRNVSTLGNKRRKTDARPVPTRTSKHFMSFYVLTPVNLSRRCLLNELTHLIDQHQHLRAPSNEQRVHASNNFILSFCRAFVQETSNLLAAEAVLHHNHGKPFFPNISIMSVLSLWFSSLNLCSKDAVNLWWYTVWK